MARDRITCVFKQISDKINSTQVAIMVCGRCLVNLMITFWRRIFLHKYNYFSSFGAGNCVTIPASNEWKIVGQQFGSVRAEIAVSNVYCLLSRMLSWQGKRCLHVEPTSQLQAWIRLHFQIVLYSVLPWLRLPLFRRPLFSYYRLAMSLSGIPNTRYPGVLMKYHNIISPISLYLFKSIPNNNGCCFPSLHGMVTQCWVNVGTVSQTVSQQ